MVTVVNPTAANARPSTIVTREGKCGALTVALVIRALLVGTGLVVEHAPLNYSSAKGKGAANQIALSALMVHPRMCRNAAAVSSGVHIALIAASWSAAKTTGKAAATDAWN